MHCITEAAYKAALQGDACSASRSVQSDHTRKIRRCMALAMHHRNHILWYTSCQHKSIRCTLFALALPQSPRQPAALPYCGLCAAAAGPVRQSPGFALPALAVHYIGAALPSRQPQPEQAADSASVDSVFPYCATALWLDRAERGPAERSPLASHPSAPATCRENLVAHSSTDI